MILPQRNVDVVILKINESTKGYVSIDNVMSWLLDCKTSQESKLIKEFIELQIGNFKRLQENSLNKISEHGNH